MSGAGEVRDMSGDARGGGPGGSSRGGSFSQRHQGHVRGAPSSSSGRSFGAPAGASQQSHVPSQPPQVSAWGRARQNAGPGRGAGGPVRGPPVTGQAVPPPVPSPTLSSASGTSSALQAGASDAGAPGNDFNGKEVKDFLKSNYLNATAGGAEEASRWKQNEVSAKRNSGAWGSKPHLMANGQDFWVHLTKQLAAREHGGG